MLALYSLRDDYEKIWRIEFQRKVFLLLVGVAFVLWRAAFLALSTKEWESEQESESKKREAAAELLNYLVTENTLPFPRETKLKPWTFHFYLNDAYFRLEKLRNLGVSLLPHETIALFDEFIKVWKGVDQESGVVESRPPHEAWDIAYGPAKAALEWLASQYGEEKRESISKILMGPLAASPNGENTISTDKRGQGKVPGAEKQIMPGWAVWG